jgi:hypothetical protein
MIGIAASVGTAKERDLVDMPSSNRLLKGKPSRCLLRLCLRCGVLHARALASALRSGGLKGGRS